MSRKTVNYSQRNLIDIGNYISRKIGKKLTSTEGVELVNIVQSLPIDVIKGTEQPILDEKHLDLIYNAFVNRQNAIPMELPTALSMNLNPDNPIEDYMHRQFNMVGQSENPLKFNMRRQGETEGRSYGQTPDNLTWKRKIPSPPKPPEERTIEILEKIYNIFGPTSYKDIHKNASQGWQTYSNLMLIERKLVLDSRFRAYDSNNPNQFKWFINSTQETSAIGEVRIPAPREIKKIQGYSFLLPYSDASQLQLGMVCVSFEEICQDSYSFDIFNQNKRIRRNFNLSYGLSSQPTSGPGQVLLTPNPAVCIFNVPISTLESLTLQFLTPDTTLSVPNCFITPTITAGNPTTFTFQNHGLNNNDLVFINNITSTTSPSIINNLTQIQGWKVSVVDPNIFTIPLNTTSVVFNNNVATICINKFRFVLEISLLCLE